LLITKSIEINPGDTLKIGEGHELLFAPFTSIAVNGGVLVAQGTKSSPISFSSINDTMGSAQSFDWNGIDIKKNSFVHLSYCFIAFSTTGITAEDSLSLSLDNCIFQNNGQWNLSLAGVLAQVPDLQPFSYNPPDPILSPLPPATISENLTLQPTPVQPKKFGRNDAILASSGLFCLAVGSVFLWKSHETLSTYNAYVPGHAGFDAAQPMERQEHFDALRADHNRQTVVGWGGVALSTINLAYLAIKWSSK